LGNFILSKAKRRGFFIWIDMIRYCITGDERIDENIGGR
jgi:hypothetical protein